MSKVKNLFQARWMSSLIFLLLLFAITGIADPGFLNYSSIINCFNTATMYTIKPKSFALGSHLCKNELEG